MGSPPFDEIQSCSDIMIEHLREVRSDVSSEFSMLVRSRHIQTAEC